MTHTTFTSSGESGVSVLIVEDNAVNARLLGEILKAGGHRFRVAADGNDGLRIAREWLPALVITDLQMPGMDGLTLTRLLKADPATMMIPIIAVSAHAMPEHFAAAKDAGADRFITKPIRFQSFLAEVADVLDAYAVRS